MSDQSTPKPQSPTTLIDTENDKRFQIELEFVQCLANPWYLNNLAQRGFFQDPAFLNYLKYLKYWQRPEYAKFIIYPHALYFLDLLQNPRFCENLKNRENATRISHAQYYHWFKWRNLIGVPGEAVIAN